MRQEQDLSELANIGMHFLRESSSLVYLAEHVSTQFDLSADGSLDDSRASNALRDMMRNLTVNEMQSLINDIRNPQVGDLKEHLYALRGARILFESLFIMTYSLAESFNREVLAYTAFLLARGPRSSSFDEYLLTLETAQEGGAKSDRYLHLFLSHLADPRSDKELRDHWEKIRIHRPIRNKLVHENRFRTWPTVTDNSITPHLLLIATKHTRAYFGASLELALRSLA